jgi:hypothetical protein
VIKNSNSCLQCGGKMQKTGKAAGKAIENQDTDMTIVEYEEFQCDSCGFKEGRVVAAFNDKFAIQTPKQSAMRQADTKGRMKKMKSTAKPRRQEPR